MSRKRRNTSSPEPDDLPAATRRKASVAEGAWSSSDDEYTDEAPQTDPWTGQTGAFPGLGDSAEFFCGPANDGIDFLRMVRSEAKAVPAVLTAPGVQAHSSGIDLRLHENSENEGGYYRDGAYTATTRAFELPEHAMLPAQERFYKGMLRQFGHVQETLRRTPPPERVHGLRPDDLRSLPEGSKRSWKEWETQILTRDPSPVQVASLDPESVLRLLGLVTRRLPAWLRSTNIAAITRVGAWTWSILGRCRHRGELSSEEIGELRTLAQVAVGLHHNQKLQIGSTAHEDDGSEDDATGQGSSHVGDESGEQQGAAVGAAASGIDFCEREQLTEQAIDDDLRARLEQQKSMVADAERRTLRNMTLDMIITVVGEVYGQRDLLEARPAWARSASAPALPSGSLC